MVGIQTHKRAGLASTQRLKGTELKINPARESASPDSRERLIQAGYELLSHRGTGATGVDLIADRANCAKATLYNIFGSKTALTLAVLQRREDLWTRGWLAAGIKARSNRPDDQLLAVFDMFHDWFQRDDFEGCIFMKLQLESSTEAEVRNAALNHLANVRLLIVDIAEQAALCDAHVFADAWILIMQGAIITAGEGNRDAARVARRLAEPVLAAWPKQA